MSPYIEEEGIILEKFSLDNPYHVKLAQEFKEDDGIKKFFPEWEELTRLSLDDDTSSYYAHVIIINGLIVGLCTNCFNSNERVVFSLGFLKEYRGLGYAKRVRNIVKKHLHDLGVTTLVGYVRKDNVSSIGSLEKVGATFIPVDNDYYQVEHDIQNLNLK